jgi:hypothetical protein
MTHGRKPRRPRPINANPFGAALRKAARLTASEIAETMAPFRLCEQRLREGAASEDQHAVLYTAVLVALGIEQTGIVRGLRAIFEAAEQALASIRERATKGGAWRATALYADELAAVREALDLHQFQLSHVSAGELHAVARKLIARTQSSGGNFTRRALEEITS